MATGEKQNEKNQTNIPFIFKKGVKNKKQFKEMIKKSAKRTTDQNAIVKLKKKRQRKRRSKKILK